LNIAGFREIYGYNHLVRQNYITFFQKHLEWNKMSANYNTALVIFQRYILLMTWRIQIDYLIAQNMILGKKLLIITIK
jgi:hypothetical protein